MSGEETTGTVWSVLVTVIVACVLSWAVFLWYAAGLFRVFRRLDGEGWRAWVPVVNEAELLRVGGRRSWEVFLWFIPVVNLYAFYLHIRAVHSIGRALGRGAGTTVLGILLPPVWSSILGWSAEPRKTTAPEGPAPHGGAPRPASAGLGSAGGALGSAPEEPVSSSVPKPRLPQEPAVAPEAMIPQPPARPATPLAPPNAPASAPPGSPAWAAFAPPSEPPAKAPERPSPALELSSGTVEDDWTVARPLTGQIELAGLMNGDEQALHGTELRSWGAEDDPESTRVVQREPLPEELEETVVVAPRRRTAWELVTDQGAVYRLDAETVVIGRNPAGDEAGIQYLAVQDSSKTLSKHHAVLELAAGSWMITDLQSTNGVTLLDGDLETQVEPGRAVPVEGPLLVGRLRLELREVHA